MIDIDMTDPWKHGNVAITVCNLIEEARTDNKGYTLDSDCESDDDDSD